MTSPETTDLVHFSLDVADGIATVLMDRRGEPVNTLSPVLLDDFVRLIDRVESDDAIRGLVIGSAKKDFLVGADIKWFSELDETSAEQAILAGQQVFLRLEALHSVYGKPVVMAIHGSALGGGLELALWGSMRIGADDPRTRLGQPEVQLGVIPAGGGTQNLPRLIGVAPALDMILTGRPANARKAKRLGILDEVVPSEMLLDIARARAAGVAGPGASKRRRPSVGDVQRLALEKNKIGRSVLFKQARDKVLAETKGNYPAPLKALEAVKVGVERGRTAGLAAEARFFAETVVTDQSKALRSIFFSQRALEKERFVPEDVSARPVHKVAVLGGGLMGGGIATVSADDAGAEVRVKEVDLAGVGRALAYVEKHLRRRVQRRRMSAFEAEKTMLRVTGSDRWVGFADTDLVIEAVFESLDLKRSILAEVEGVVGADTVFASNTSSLPIGAIAEASSRPETVLGMHYFSPVEKMPLLEVIVTPQTADWATATAVEFGRRQGKTVIVVNDGTGFYTSRVLGPYSNEAFFLLEEGASVEDIDSAMTAWGFPVGPLLLADEVGIDVGAKISLIMIDAFGERMRGPAMMAGLVEDDRKGRKNRRGFYRYDDKGERGGVDDTVYAALGLGPRRAIDRQEIQERISLQFLNEAARILEEGVLRSARDGDIGAVFGLGFPPFRGGPFTWIDTMGAKTVVERLEHYRAIHGERFAPAAILVDAAAEDRRFRSTPAG